MWNLVLIIIVALIPIVTEPCSDFKLDNFVQCEQINVTTQEDKYCPATTAMMQSCHCADGNQLQVDKEMKHYLHKTRDDASNSGGSKSMQNQCLNAKKQCYMEVEGQDDAKMPGADRKFDTDAYSVVNQGYDCRRVYIMPQYVRDFALDNLIPHDWRDWVCHHLPLLGVLITCFGFLASYIPVFFVLYKTCLEVKEQSKLLLLNDALCYDLNKKLGKEYTERISLEEQVQETAEARDRLSIALQEMTHERDAVIKEKLTLEAQFLTRDECPSESKKYLNAQIQRAEQLRVLVLSLEQEKSQHIQFVTEQKAQMKNLEQYTVALEAQIEQLEQDKFDALTSLDQLKSKYQQMSTKYDMTSKGKQIIVDDEGEAQWRDLYQLQSEMYKIKELYREKAKCREREADECAKQLHRVQNEIKRSKNELGACKRRFDELEQYHRSCSAMEPSFRSPYYDRWHYDATLDPYYCYSDPWMWMPPHCDPQRLDWHFSAPQHIPPQISSSYSQA